MGQRSAECKEETPRERPASKTRNSFDIVPPGVLQEARAHRVRQCRSICISGEEMKSCRAPLCVLFAFLAVLLLSRPGLAVKYMYRYVDDRGEAFFADDLQKVPEKYRAAAAIVSTEEVDERAEAAAQAERVQAAAKAVEVRQEQAVALQRAAKAQRMHVAWSAAAVASVVIILIALAKIDVLKRHEKAVNAVRTALVLLLIAFLAYAHARDVLRLFGTVGETIASVEEKQAARGRKAAQFYKSLEQMMDQAAQVQKDQQAQENALEER